MDEIRLKIGVSACLLGERVRYDAGHKYNSALLHHLSADYELLSICPEVAAGLGVPRPPVQLMVREGETRALGVVDEQLDVTLPLVNYGRLLAQELDGVCGYVFKSRSPSCGLGTTPIRAEAGALHYGNGLFAQQIVQAWPLLPVIDEESLEQTSLRQQFLQQVAAYGRRLAVNASLDLGRL